MHRNRTLEEYRDVLGIDIRAIAARTERFSWMDLCCGEGTALRQLAIPRARGIDLVAILPYVLAGDVATYPTETYDLVTCVHGAHYLGDVLGTLSRWHAALRPGGVLAANIDWELVDVAGLPLERAFSEGVRVTDTIHGAIVMAEAGRFLHPAVRHLRSESYDEFGETFTKSFYVFDS